MRRTINRWLSAAAVALALAATLATTALAVPEMDVTFYGRVYWGETVLTRTDTDYTVSVSVNGETLASYTMGERDTDAYVLPVPFSSATNLAGRAHPGETLRFAIDGIALPHHDRTLTEAAGTDVELDLQAELVNLTVLNDLGVGEPSGTTSMARGTAVTVAAPEVMTGEAGVRYALAGYTGSGSAPEAGVESTVSLTLDEDSTVAWQWETGYRIETALNPFYGGEIAFDLAPDAAGYHAAGDVVTLTVVPQEGFLFREWGGDAGGRQDSVQVLVNGPKTVSAVFDRDANLDGIPDDWQLLNFFSANAPDADPDADPDGDGMTNRKEWTAGTDPTDAACYFRIHEAAAGGAGAFVLRWFGVRERTYRVFVTDRLPGPWTAYPDAETTYAGADAMIEVEIPPGEEGAMFVRLEVRR